jgi:hypothetical protein
MICSLKRSRWLLGRVPLHQRLSLREPPPTVPRHPSQFLPPPGPPAPSAPAKPLNSSNSKNKNRHNCTNYQRPPPASFTTAANSWNGTLQLWAGDAHPSLLGAHPGSHQPPRLQAFMAQTPSSAPVPGFQGGYPMVPALHGGSSYRPHSYGSMPPEFGAPSTPPDFGAPGTPPSFSAPGPQFFSGVPAPPDVVWDQNALTAAFSTTSLTPPPSAEWYMDSDAHSHMTSTTGNLLSSQPPSSSTPSSIIVGNGSLLPVTSTGHTFFPTPNHPLHLSHILVSPHIIKN